MKPEPKRAPVDPVDLTARAKAQRAMAQSVLRSASSAAVRQQRYQEHMEKARALEEEARRLAAARPADPDRKVLSIRRTRGAADLSC